MNRLYGMDGDDMLTGKKGDETIDAGKGDDMLTGGAGDDTFAYRMIDDTRAEDDNQTTDDQGTTDFDENVDESRCRAIDVDDDTDGTPTANGDPMVDGGAGMDTTRPVQPASSLSIST